LGGRLDSTNIIKPLVAAITNVDLDHQNILGKLEEIATEKAGIIKPIPIVPTKRDLVKNIIQEKGIVNHSRFIDATEISDLPTDLKGNYQKKNIKWFWLW
jgi:dihydrofolate synthase/folylpolyglutamate synthase